MDIEGFEHEVTKNSFRTIGQADVISIELHGQKIKLTGCFVPGLYSDILPAGARTKNSFQACLPTRAQYLKFCCLQLVCIRRLFI